MGVDGGEWWFLESYDETGGLREGVGWGGG